MRKREREAEQRKILKMVEWLGGDTIAYDIVMAQMDRMNRHRACMEEVAHLNKISLAIRSGKMPPKRKHKPPMVTAYLSYMGE